jgi:hypothetical protein
MLGNMNFLLIPTNSSVPPIETGMLPQRFGYLRPSRVRGNPCWRVPSCEISRNSAAAVPIRGLYPCVLHRYGRFFSATVCDCSEIVSHLCGQSTLASSSWLVVYLLDFARSRHHLSCIFSGFQIQSLKIIAAIFFTVGS